jgi:hypothetical protein
VVRGHFSLVLLLQGGLLHFLCPFSLAPFTAFCLPSHLPTPASATFLGPLNLLLCASPTTLLAYELDAELKALSPGTSLFAHQHYSMFEDFRTTLIQPELTSGGGGLFKKHVTVRSSLERNRKTSEERKRGLSGGAGRVQRAAPITKMVNLKKVEKEGKLDLL